MAGTLTVTRDPRVAPNQGKCIERIVIAWTSDGAGAADISLGSMYGFLVKLVTDPGAAAPTANYDITLIDENGLDALAGAGLDRHTTNTEQVYPVALNAQTPVFLCGIHTFNVANAGAAKNGTAILYTIEAT